MTAQGVLYAFKIKAKVISKSESIFFLMNSFAQSVELKDFSENHKRDFYFELIFLWNKGYINKSPRHTKNVLPSKHC